MNLLECFEDEYMKWKIFRNLIFEKLILSKLSIEAQIFDNTYFTAKSKNKYLTIATRSNVRYDL